jgi:hypothetical protein
MAIRRPIFFFAESSTGESMYGSVRRLDEAFFLPQMNEYSTQK